MSITYSGMHCKRLINPPRHVIDKYLIAIWRHHDNIWRISDAARGGSTGFQQWKMYFIDKLEHLFKHNIFNYFFCKHIWRHHDNIWRTSDATRGGSTGFHRWKLYFIDKLGIVNKYLMEHLFKYNVFYIVQLICFWRIPLLCRTAVFCSLTIKDLS